MRRASERARLAALATALVAALVAGPVGAQESFGGGHVETEEAGAPQAPATEEPLPPRAPVARTPWALRLDGAYAMRRLFDLGVTGGDFGIAFGAQPSRHFAAWWATRLQLGGTDSGLSVWSLRSGAEVEAVYDPVRFGLGLGLMVIDVGRAERPDDVRAWGLEGRAFVRFDAYRTDGFAIFLRAAIDGGVETSSGSAFWGPGIGAGVELGLSGSRPAPDVAVTRPVPWL
ncbi:MAG: hypothetical protein JWP97_5051 [Labilithrix sp.]|nr:hypothetical protein [Labilithrix sp.]